MNVSVLIDELEARKNDYILVADVISLMADATNSTPSQVVDYLEANGINDHLAIFYMDDFYSFEAYNGYLQGLDNDADIKYFQKSDVMAFEPITKHGIFKDSKVAPTIITDVYGRTYDINQHKKNREDDYLTLDESVSLLNSNTDINDSGYDYRKLRDLARKKLITPCFYFCGYVGSFSFSNTKNFYTEVITGYFTYRLLTEEICSYNDYITLPSCETGNEIKIYRILEKQTAAYVDSDDGVFLLEKKPQGFHDAEKLELKCIEADEIRFSKKELDSYIASFTCVSVSYEPPAQDSELLKKIGSLQAENDDLNARLFTARNTYKQHQNEIKELTEKNEKAETEKAEFIEQLNNQATAPIDESMLQIILDESHEDHAPDLKHAIQLWIDLYIHDGIKGDSHSSKANIWIKKNTNYVDNAISSIGRIREIATPFKDFGAKRSREEEK